MGDRWTKGQQNQNQQRVAPGRYQPAYDILARAFLGQLAQPPETAISVPLQQAVSQLQAGGPSGSLIGRLTGGGMAGQEPGNQWGLQTREELGLPARQSYFPFVPTAEQVAGMGLLPNIRAGTPGGRREQKLEGRLGARQARGKDTSKVEGKLATLREQRRRTGQGYT